MNSQNCKIRFKEGNTNEIQEGLTNKDYVYNNLVLDTPDAINRLGPELEKCCIINSDYDHFIRNIDKFIKENEITLECLKETLIIPGIKDDSALFKLKLPENSDSQLKHIFDYNFNACAISLKQFIESCCKSASIFEIREYYNHISSFKEKIEQRYRNLNNESLSGKDTYPDNFVHRSVLAKCNNSYLRNINNAFADIDMYFKNILLVIENIINKITAENEEKKFNKVLKQNMGLGIISSVVAVLGIIATVIVSIFKFK